MPKAKHLVGEFGLVSALGLVLSEQRQKFAMYTRQVGITQAHFTSIAMPF